MKTTKLIVLVTLLCLGQMAKGQKVTFKGEVRDSLNIAIQFANVMAVDTTKKTIAAFAVTDDKGLFKLTLDKDQLYQLKVSFVGFKPFEVLMKGQATEDAPVLIKLNPDVRMVAGVEVVQEMPVTISGDTITYDTDVFTDDSEQKLGDVLEKLPGFEVDEDGGVKVQGKNVNKLLVEGKEFFGGDTKMGTKNLPANAIDKVQVLRNFNDVSPMKGLGNNEQLALNIKLKEDKKNIVFGDIAAGAGPQERYLVDLNAYYYGPKANINLIAGANNIGDQTFTMNDYYRFTGGLINLGANAGSRFRTSRDDLGIPTANKNNAQQLDTKLGALNFNFTPSEKWRHSGFIIGSDSDNRLGSLSQRTYIRQAGDSEELLSSNSRVENASGLFKYNARYTPNPDLQLDYSAFIKVADISNSQNQTSEFTNFNNDIENSTSQTPLSVEQQLQAFYAPTAADVFSFQSTFQYKEQDPLYDLLTTQRPFETLIPLGDASVFNLLQNKKVFTRKQESALNYYRILNKTNHINFKIGNSFTSQNMTTRISQRRVGQNDLEFNDPALNNDVGYTFSDLYLGMGYKTKLGKLTLSPSLNLHRYSFANRQLGTEEKIEKTLLLPKMYAKYDARGTQSITMNYDINTEFTDVQNVASGLIIQNYNTLFEGNRMLENSWYHQFSLNYFNFNMYNFMNIYGGLTYQKRFDGITNAIQFNGLERVNSPLNIGLANELTSGYFSFDKRFDSFRINLNANLSESKRNNLISDFATQNTSFSQNYKATIETTFFKKLNVKLAYTKIFNQYDGNTVSSRFETDRPSVDINWRIAKGLRLKGQYEYNKYQSRETGLDQTYDLMNADLTYRKLKSKWEFRFAALNLLNTTSIRQDSFSESLISTYEYFIQKRYYMLSVKYHL